MNWDWKKTLGGMFSLSLMLLSFSFVYQNQILLNKLFLPQIPVGYLLLFGFGILISYHIYRTLKWYHECIKAKRYRINLIVHICLYLTVFSIALSIPMALSTIMQPLEGILQDSSHSNLTQTTEQPTINESPIPVETSNVAEQPTESPSVTEAVTPEYNKAVVKSSFMSDPKTLDYSYVLRGIHGHIPYTVYGGLNDYLKGLPRYIAYRAGTKQPTDKDFIMRNLNNEDQKQLLDPLIDEIKSITPNKDDQARIAVSLVQNINYDKASLTSGIMTNKYPYEVLYTGCGVCEEKSELLTYLLRGLGYEVVIFTFNAENHAAVGIKCPQHYSYWDIGYCFVESDKPSIITDSSGEYVGVGNVEVGKLTSMPNVIKICDGISFDSVSEEYNDAITYENIIGNGSTILSQSDYKKWRWLTSKYGINNKDN